MEQETVESERDCGKKTPSIIKKLIDLSKGSKHPDLKLKYGNIDMGRETELDTDEYIAEKYEKLYNQAITLVEEFKELDCSKLEIVIDWLKRIQPYTENNKVNSSIPRQKIIGKLENEGFKANENTGKDFIKEDKVNFGRYVVGQAISCWKVYCIHRDVTEYAEVWQKKFLITT